MTMPPVSDFRHTVLAYYQKHGRHHLPWRHTETAGYFDPYKILVSEIMLQQTQVSRVIPKFEAFMKQYPTIQSLADAPLAAVLQAWSGLGYNRRAKYLWLTAKRVRDDFNGKLPGNRKQLESLPGIGPGTAGAILVYAFNQPALFIETNIRSVIIHHFFHDHKKVTDSEIADVLAITIDENPREWYWALMDYGTYLKQTIGPGLDKVHGYTAQSKFEGSRRQIRGQVLRVLSGTSQPLLVLKKTIPDDRLPSVLNDLVREGLIEETNASYRLAGTPDLDIRQ